MRRLATALTAAATTAAALGAPAAAGAFVQIDRGIAGARIGNTRVQVRAALGKPSSIKSGRNDFGRFIQYRYRAAKLTVTFQGRVRVTSVDTTGLGDRTTRGVGVGSTQAEVEAGVPGVKCEAIGGQTLCHTHALTAGQRVTAFPLVNGKVSRVTVGIVID